MTKTNAPQPIDPDFKRAETQAPILDALALRWSSRGFDPEKEIPEASLIAVAEAARWAPSSENNQPWRYLFVGRKSENREIVEEALTRGNAWAKRAACVVVPIMRETYEKNDAQNPTALVEMGLSIGNLMAQGVAEGLIVHPIAGFSEMTLLDGLGIPEEYRIPVLVVLGHYLPAVDLRPWQVESEYGKRTRKAFDSIISFSGKYSDLT